jgi:hypothetical protein
MHIGALQQILNIFLLKEKQSILDRLNLNAQKVA